MPQTTPPAPDTASLPDSPTTHSPTHTPTPTPTPTDPIAVLAKHGRTFYLASFLLPRHTRADSALLYAFCRFVDDTADEAPDPDLARAALQNLQQQLCGHAPPDPLIQETLALFTRRAIPPAAAQELISGALSDLSPTLITPDDRALLRYCYQVAGTVGLMMCGALQVHDLAALPHAIDLGVAMQLTNICRDVLADAHIRRIYLPASRLLAVGIDPASLLASPLQTPAAPLAAVVSDLLALAERYYDSARAGFHFLPRRARPAIMAAAWMYRAIGRKSAHLGYPVLRGRLVVGKPTKLAWLSRALLSAPFASRWRAPHDPSLHLHFDGLPGANTPPL
jgi:15-cis-phytoene synthase